MATGSVTVVETPLITYALRRADDALILGHRLSEWCGHAPMLEEDMALANMALDLLGQARSLYGYAAMLEAAGQDEDDFAFRRDERSYRNLLLVEQPNGDFAQTILRQFLYAAFIDPYWRMMTGSKDETLAAIAAKAEKESAYHLRHSAEWVIRLGDGTAESHARIDAALTLLWPYADEMFSIDSGERGLIEAGIAADLDLLRPIWRETLDRILPRATLSVPVEGWSQKGGRAGIHSEHLGHLLAELQHLQRSHPGATW
jgi:ring-1,2-phenylacetyl-CoA epoxidase subunit PaaC